jgi:hypothetical protein
MEEANLTETNAHLPNAFRGCYSQLAPNKMRRNVFASAQIEDVSYCGRKVVAPLRGHL